MTTKKKGLGQLPTDNTMHPDTHKNQEDGPKVMTNSQEEVDKKTVEEFVKNPEITVEQLLTDALTKIGENIKVVRFSRFSI